VPGGCDQFCCDSSFLRLVGVACYHDYQTEHAHWISGVSQDVQQTQQAFCPCLIHCDQARELCWHW
jgi:hypothetical protein